MSKKITLGYLGYKFQTSLINQILHPANKKFSDMIIDRILNVNESILTLLISLINVTAYIMK